jgi:hypothetical protein
MFRNSTKPPCTRGGGVEAGAGAAGSGNGEAVAGIFFNHSPDDLSHRQQGAVGTAAE